MHLAAVGADTKFNIEIRLGFLSFFDLIVVDSIEQCQIRAEICTNDLKELSAILSEKRTGRNHSNVIIIEDFKGVAVHDVIIASKVFKIYLKNRNEI